jgi:outer membrane protein assembly factor BamA
LRRLCLILLVLLAAAASAQTRQARKRPSAKPAQSQSPGTFPIASLRVEGNHIYTAAQVLKVAALEVGQKADKAAFEAARDRLLATGAFASVGYHYAPAQSGSGYAAVFDIQEEGQFYPFRFEELPATDDDLRAWLQKKDPLFQTKVPGTEQAMNRYVQWITEFLAARNFHEPVTGKLSSEFPPDLVVLFRPNALRRAVAQVTFTGNKDIPTTVLQRAIVETAVGAGYTENRFRQFLDHSIRPLYEARGRLRVAFPKITTQPASDVKGLAVSVEVQEGPVYKFGKLGIDGSDDLLKMIKTKTGQVANFDEINAARDRIDRSFRRQGYLNAKSEARRTLHDDKLTVDVEFHIDEGPQYLMGNLSVSGLDIESEPYLRKLWAIAPGKPFNVEYPDHFLSVVREEGVFDNLGKTTSETKVNAQDHTVDVKLSFAGAPPAPKKPQDSQTAVGPEAPVPPMLL